MVGSRGAGDSRVFSMKLGFDSLGASDGQLLSNAAQCVENVVEKDL